MTISEEKLTKGIENVTKVYEAGKNSVNLDNYYTMAETNEILQSFEANLDDKKADKADTYTKSEVDTSIETIRMMADQATNEANIAYSLSRQNETDITELQSDVSLLEASQGWKLIAETKLTQEEFDAANGEVTAIVLDLGKKIESADEWYSETMIRVEIPKCKDLGSNASISSGKLRVMFGNTPQQAMGG